MARLIYTDFENFFYIKSFFQDEGVIFHYDVDDSNLLRNIEANHVFLISDEAKMRGYDYCAKEESGIALFLDKSLSCKRTLIQALGRVGRYAQNCKRFINEKRNPIDS